MVLAAPSSKPVSDFSIPSVCNAPEPGEKGALLVIEEKLL